MVLITTKITPKLFHDWQPLLCRDLFKWKRGNIISSIWRLVGFMLIYITSGRPVAFRPHSSSEPCMSLSAHMAQAPSKVSLVGIPADLHLLHVTARHSLLSASYSGPPTACLTVSLPPKGRRDRVSTFRIVDPVDDLGAPCTPVVQQFRAGS